MSRNLVVSHFLFCLSFWEGSSGRFAIARLPGPWHDSQFTNGKPVSGLICSPWTLCLKSSVILSCLWHFATQLSVPTYSASSRPTISLSYSRTGRRGLCSLKLAHAAQSATSKKIPVTDFTKRSTTTPSSHITQLLCQSTLIPLVVVKMNRFTTGFWLCLISLGVPTSMILPSCIIPILSEM